MSLLTLNSAMIIYHSSVENRPPTRRNPVGGGEGGGL